MRRIAYQLLGFAVWRSAMWYLRRRFGGASRKIAVGALLAAMLAALLLGARRRSGSS
jgi:hypothetical protein